jgi:hypothetical protein
VEVVALIVAKMSDRFQSNESTLNFCVKLEMNASETFAVLSEPYGREAMKTFKCL